MQRAIPFSIIIIIPVVAGSQWSCPDPHTCMTSRWPTPSPRLSASLWHASSHSRLIQGSVAIGDNSIHWSHKSLVLRRRFNLDVFNHADSWWSRSDGHAGWASHLPSAKACLLLCSTPPYSQGLPPVSQPPRAVLHVKSTDTQPPTECFPWHERRSSRCTWLYLFPYSCVPVLNRPTLGKT